MKSETIELRKRWVTALRSGNYIQATRTLRSMQGFCCLGVLCDLINPQGWVSSVVSSEHYTFKSGGEDAEAFLPSSVALTVDIMKDGLRLEPELSLAQMNDAFVSFGEIAKIIEADTQAAINNQPRLLVSAH